MQFVILAKDGEDPEALNRRMAVRDAHLANMKKLKEQGHYILGGPLLDDEGKMIGSMIVAEFASREVLDEWLKNEPYMTGDVWRYVDVYPFRNAGVATPAQN